MSVGINGHPCANLKSHFAVLAAPPLTPVMALMEASLLIFVFTVHCNAAVTSTPSEPTEPLSVPTKPSAGPPAPPEPTSMTPNEKLPVPSLPGYPSVALCQVNHTPTLNSFPSVSGTGSCPKDVPRVDCPVNPCMLLHCPLKGAECVVDSCGKCRPRWINDRKEVTMECLGEFHFFYTSLSYIKKLRSA